MILLLALVFSHTNGEIAADSCTVAIGRSLEDTGFHRTLRTTIRYDFPACCPCSPCSVELREVLPRGVYVDPYQLHDLNLNATISPPRVDIEAPSWLSTELEVTLTSPAPIAGFHVMSLPLHARYHPVSDAAHFATVTIVPPSLSFTCTQSRAKNLGRESEVIPSLELEVPLGSSQDDLLVGTVTAGCVAAATAFLLLLTWKAT